MMIPLVNPSRSRKSRPVRARGLKRKSAKAKMAWVRSFIHKAKKRPARRRRIHKPSARSSIMRVISLRPRRTHKRRARRNPRFGQHRPTLSYGPKGWKRSKRSKLMRKRTWVNPRKRRVSRRRRWNPVATVTNSRRSRRTYRRYRRNPYFPIMEVGKEGIMIAGGLVLGMYGIKGLAYLPPIQKYRNFFGVGELLIGTLFAGLSKNNKYLRSLAITFAGVGLYDLIACNVKQLALPTVHTGAAHPAVAAAEGSVSTHVLAQAAGMPGSSGAPGGYPGSSGAPGGYPGSSGAPGFPGGSQSLHGNYMGGSQRLHGNYMGDSNDIQDQD